MPTAWGQVLTVVHSWTYVALGSALGVGALMLFLGATGWKTRLLALGAFFGILTGLFAPILPWLGRSIDFQPGPIEAFSRAIIFPLFYSVPAVSPLVILAFILLSTLILGKVFCGWVCPIGVIQEIIAAVRPHPPRRLTLKVSQAARAGLLLAFVVLVLWKRRILFDWIDPYPVLRGDRRSDIGAYIAAGVLLLLSAMVYRPFCGLACPVGLVTSVLGKISLFSIRLTPHCDRCGDCLGERVCPGFRAAVQAEPIRTECFACGSCIRACPHGAVRYARRSWNQPAVRRFRGRGVAAGGGI